MTRLFKTKKSATVAAIIGMVLLLSGVEVAALSGDGELGVCEPAEACTNTTRRTTTTTASTTTTQPTTTTSEATTTTTQPTTTTSAATTTTTSEATTTSQGEEVLGESVLGETVTGDKPLPSTGFPVGILLAVAGALLLIGGLVARSAHLREEATGGATPFG